MGIRRKVDHSQVDVGDVNKPRAHGPEMSITTFVAEVDRVSQQVDRVRVVQIALERTESSAARLEARMAGLESLKAQVDEIALVVARLSSTRDDVIEAAERFQTVRSALEVARDQHIDTGSRLSEVQASVERLEGKIEAIDRHSVRVERVREDAERALSAAAEFEARSAFLAQLETSLANLGSTGEEISARMKKLDERKTELDEIEKRIGLMAARLDDADHRFDSVGRRTEEIMRADERISAVIDRANEASEGLELLGSGLESTLSKNDQLTAMAARVAEMMAEFELREKALQQATDHLGRATALRQSASEAASALEEQGRKLSASLAAGEEQASMVADLAARIETRAESLRFTEKRFDEFEEKLSRLQRAEDEVVGHIEGIIARQESVEAVRDELARAFGTAEKTMQEVRSISEARHDIAKVRATLEDVLDEAAKVDEIERGIQQRKSDIDAAEVRLAKIDELLAEVRSSLDSFRSRQADLEHLVEKASQLKVQTKEAEALITALREERDLVSGQPEVLADIRDDEKR